MTFLDKEWDEKGILFYNQFGCVGFDLCYNSGLLSYSRNADKTVYKADFLTLEEVTDLMQKSLDTGVDYLYKACKDHPLPPFDPDVLY